MFKKVALFVLAITAIALARGAIAAHDTTFTSIDAIDHVFPSGGGTFNGVLSDGSDNAWLVFAATAGDNLQIDVTSNNFRVAVLLQDTADGVFSVGDVLDVTDFNSSQVGNGTDLTILDQEVDFTGPVTMNFVAPYTGQYAIAFAVSNEDSNYCCDYGATLSGNVGSVDSTAQVVPVMPLTGLVLTTLGLLLLARRRLLLR